MVDLAECEVDAAGLLLMGDVWQVSHQMAGDDFDAADDHVRIDVFSWLMSMFLKIYFGTKLRFSVTALGCRVKPGIREASNFNKYLPHPCSHMKGASHELKIGTLNYCIQ